MRKYCKAYHLRDLRLFPNWTEQREENEPELTDNEIVYLWDDLTVVRSPITPQKGLVFDNITSEWQSFCKTTLLFEIPDDLYFAYEQMEETKIEGNIASA